MARPRNLTPSYLRHAKSGKGRTSWTDSAGVRHERLHPGPFGSVESRQSHARLCLELASSPGMMPADQKADMSVAELLAAYQTFAQRHYAGSSEYDNILAAIKTVRELYAALPVAEFGPLRLKAVRESFVAAGLCRNQVNKRVDRVRRAFRWGVAEELVPSHVYEALRAVPGLRSGRTEAHDNTPVQPVPTADIDAVIPRLPAHVRALVELMRLTGARPGELCRMTLGQVDRSGATWLYRPARHKTSHIGKERVIPFGPRAREVLAAHLAGRILEPGEPVFSPRRAREERYARMRANRKSPVQPSQLCRALDKPAKLPAEQYTPNAINHAIRAAAKKAGVPYWNVYRLRHTAATEIRRRHGLEAAQVLLGHARADVTQVYAEKNLTAGIALAESVG